MDKLLKLNIKIPKDIIGSNKYSLQLEITNMTDNKIIIDSIEPDILPGELISKNKSDSLSELDGLEYEKKSLVEELEMQLAKAYERQKIKDLNIFEFFIYIYTSMPEMIATLITKTNPTLSFPLWAKKAFSIKEWDDVAALDETIMCYEKDDSLLRKAFNINKNKLKKVLDKISDAKKSNSVSLDDSYPLNSKETITIPFYCRAPNLYRQKELELLFSLKFKFEGSNSIFNQNISDKISFRASNFAVPLGAIIGGFFGFLVKLIFITKGTWFDNSFWTTLLGSIVLAIVFSLFMNNSSGSKKIISVEGFVGGIILGVIPGLFTENIIEYFEKFIP